MHVDHVGYRARARRRDVRLSVDGGNPIEGLDLDGVDLYAPTEAMDDGTAREAHRS